MFFKNKILILFIFTNIALQNTYAMEFKYQKLNLIRPRTRKNSLTQAFVKLDETLNKLTKKQTYQLLLNNFYKPLIKECNKILITIIEQNKTMKELFDTLPIKSFNKENKKCIEKQNFENKYDIYYKLFLESDFKKAFKKLYLYLEDNIFYFYKRIFTYRNQKNQILGVLDQNSKQIYSEIKEILQKELGVAGKQSFSITTMSLMQKLENQVLEMLEV